VVETKKSPTWSWAKSIGIGATPLEEVLFVDSTWLTEIDKRTGSLRAHQPSSNHLQCRQGFCAALGERVTQPANVDYPMT